MDADAEDFPVVHAVSAPVPVVAAHKTYRTADIQLRVADAITAFAGTAMAGPADTAESLLDRSDTAMYQAKRDGGGRFHHHPLLTPNPRT